jgi:hypothetical protein
MSAPKKKTKAELDQERLREVEARMKEALDLLAAGATREKADSGLETARQNRARHAGNGGGVFHAHGSKRVPLKMSTKSSLDLAEALKLRIRIGDFALELEDSLQRMAGEQVELLERELKRARN